MHPRMLLNFVFVQVRPGPDASKEDREKFEADLYSPL